MGNGCRVFSVEFRIVRQTSACLLTDLLQYTLRNFLERVDVRWTMYPGKLDADLTGQMLHLRSCTKTEITKRIRVEQLNS